MVTLTCSITNVFESNQTLTARTKKKKKKRMKQSASVDIRLLECSLTSSSATEHCTFIEWILLCAVDAMQFIPQNDLFIIFMLNK